MADKDPIIPVTAGPVTVQWEHLFAIDHKRTVNGKKVGDDRYNLTVLIDAETAKPLLQAAAQAVSARTSDQDVIRKAVFERVTPVEDEELKKLGFAYRMKTYSRDPIPVVNKKGGAAIEPPAAKLAQQTYPQFGLGVRQGAQVYIAVGFRVYEGDNSLGASAFLNAVLLDTSVEPRQLPGGRPSPRKLFGGLIEGAEASPGAEKFAGLIEGDGAAGAQAVDDVAAALGLKF